MSEGLELLTVSLVFVNIVEIRTVRHITNRCYNLKLCRSFVDGSDTSITIETFTGIVSHKARTTMNLNTVVSILIGKFAAQTFSNGVRLSALREYAFCSMRSSGVSLRSFEISSRAL
jgi:hypothetical protein